MLQKLNKKFRKGQGLVEYVLIIGLILIVAIGAMRILGGNINTKLNTINTELTE